MPPEPLTVGCWPGRSFAWNDFARIFSDSLEAAGCGVIDVADPRRLSRRLDVLHVHWPDQLFWGGTGDARAAWRIASTLRALSRLKARGTRIVWMVHNLKPHETGGLRALLWQWLSRGVAGLADGFMTLSPATVPLARRAFPRLAAKPAAFAWHPAYPRLPDLPDRARCRGELGIADGETLIAFLGLIRPYKGIDELIAAFRASAPQEARLLIAGACEKPDEARQMETLAAQDARIRLSIGRLDEQAFARRMIAADAIALPYRRYLHSGSIVHALSYARPVVTPAAPFADALAELVGRPWVRTYEGGAFPAEAFVPLDAESNAPDITMLDPTHIGTAARRLYLQLLRPREASLPIEAAPFPPSESNLMKPTLRAIRDNLADAKIFGSGVLRRHLPRAKRRGLHSWTMPGVGQVAIRRGTTDMEVFRQVFRNGEYDLARLGRLKQVNGWYETILAAGRTPLIIDAGANIGAASLWFARQFPKARVIAVEPEPGNAAMCRHNFGLNERLQLREAAIGAVPGRIVLDNPAAKAWSPRSRRAEGEDGIAIVTIPELVASVPDAELLIVKIDIEGFESDLFAQNLDWLDQARVVMIEIHDWMMPGRGTSRSLQKAMGERDFEMMINGENIIYVNAELRAAPAIGMPAASAAAAPA